MKQIKDNQSGKEAPVLRKNDLVELRIASLAPGGEGVSRDLGIPVFVPRTAPGDIVEVRLFDVRKDFARGELVRIVQPSDQRSEPPCKLFKVCGGCQWQHISYQHQLAAKTDIVRQAIKHIGRQDTALVADTIGAGEPLYYRNKVQFPVQTVRSTGRMLAGYFKQNSHELVNIKHCPVQPEPLDRMLEAVKNALQARRISAYDETSHKGLVRHIAGRYSFAQDKVLITLVINHAAALPAPLQSELREAAEDVMRAVPEVAGVCLNFNPDKGNRIMGNLTVCLAGTDNIVETIRSGLPFAPERLKDGMNFRITPQSFFQVNTDQAQRLFDQVLDFATQSDSADRIGRLGVVIDAYAGVGTIGQWLAAISDSVICIEEEPAAVDDGLENSRLNGLENLSYRQGKVENVVSELLREGVRPDVVVVDPPRKGVDQRGLLDLIKLGPAKFIYVSCNPGTLARDLKILADNGYKTKQIQPIDLFPQTYHVESVTLLERSI